jgi:Ethylbenzene dehydrogenase
MKTNKFFTGAILLGILFSGCSKDEDPPPPPPPGTSSTTVFSKKVSTPPTIDGTIDGLWSNSQKLETTVTVPSAGPDEGKPGQDVFEGVVGDAYNVTMRSVYDDNNIYFLVEYDDPTEDLDRQSWYYDNEWKQEYKLPDKPDANGKWFYEDKIGFQWNINPSAGWDAATCYSNCHTGIDYASHGNKSARHWTNTGELVDTWHWKSVRTNFYNQLDDKYFNDTEFGGSGGRHGDTKTGGGYSNNKQDLPVTGVPGDTISVPKYVIPDQSNYYWITEAEITGGTAKLVTAVDSNGVLSYAGGTIDPASGGYEQSTGAKRFPSVYINAFQGGRGDVNARGLHTGTGWVVEISRALTTADVGNEDVLFDVNQDYLFGFAVFDNTSIAHAIRTNLILEFK